MSNYRSDEQQRDVEEGWEWQRRSGPLYAEIDALKRKVKRLEAERDRLRLKLNDGGCGAAEAAEGSEVMKDSDGNECDLPVLCMREPGWAANRIQALTGELEASRALHVEFFEEEARTRTLLKGLAARMREWADEIDKLIAEPGA